MDSLLGQLLDGIKEIDKDVNIVIVSDHGMAQLSPQRIFFLDQVFNISTVNIIACK